MARSGIQFPDVVDLTSRAKDGTIRLIIAETATLTGNHVLGLQQKLQNYLSFALNRSPPRILMPRVVPSASA